MPVRSSRSVQLHQKGVLTQEQEPIIPFQFYDDFRSSLSADTPVEETVERYRSLIRDMPPLNQYLLLYVLDLLSVFAKKADKNLMTAPSTSLILSKILTHTCSQVL